MLEIEKQRDRFSDSSVKDLTKDYDRNFLHSPKEEKHLPNSPYPEEGTGQLPLRNKENYSKGKKK